MARNAVQFQKGYSLGQFFAEYGTEDQCAEAPHRWRWPNGFVCLSLLKTSSILICLTFPRVVEGEHDLNQGPAGREAV